MKPGMRVLFLHQKGGGILNRIEGDIGYILTDEGWELPHPLSQLVLVQSVSASLVDKNDIKKNTIPLPSILKSNEEQPFDWDSEKRKIPKIRDRNFKVDAGVGEDSDRPKYSKKSTTDTSWEIDLHIHELMNDSRSLTKGEIVQIQLNAFHAFMEKVIHNHIKKVVIIHGVGTGKLKEEVYLAATRYAIRSIHDASYRKYGRGATEIILGS